MLCWTLYETLKPLRPFAFLLFFPAQTARLTLVGWRFGRNIHRLAGRTPGAGSRMNRPNFPMGRTWLSSVTSRFARIGITRNGNSLFYRRIFRFAKRPDPFRICDIHHSLTHAPLPDSEAWCCHHVHATNLGHSVHHRGYGCSRPPGCYRPP